MSDLWNYGLVGVIAVFAGLFASALLTAASGFAALQRAKAREADARADVLRAQARREGERP